VLDQYILPVVVECGYAAWSIVLCQSGGSNVDILSTTMRHWMLCGICTSTDEKRSDAAPNRAKVPAKSTSGASSTTCPSAPLKGRETLCNLIHTSLRPTMPSYLLPTRKLDQIFLFTVPIPRTELKINTIETTSPI